MHIVVNVNNNYPLYAVRVAKAIARIARARYGSGGLTVEAAITYPRTFVAVDRSFHEDLTLVAGELLDRARMRAHKARLRGIRPQTVSALL